VQHVYWVAAECNNVGAHALPFLQVLRAHVLVHRVFMSHTPSAQRMHNNYRHNASALTPSNVYAITNFNHINAGVE
jgi:hypothetical protein